MEELKREILLMITNYWAIDNNEECEEATLLFLKRNNMLEDFNNFRDLEVSEVSEEIKVDYENNLKYI